MDERVSIRSPFPIGIDNYGLFPLKLAPLETLRWAHIHGAEGVAFSGLETDHQRLINKSYLTDLKQYAAEYKLYLEWGSGQHIPRDLSTWDQKDIFGINEQAAKEAEALGTRIVRSCSGGLMRWQDDSLPTETLLTEMAQSLQQQKSMLKDYNVLLAIETHFEFTTHELLRVFEMCETQPGDYLGICLDTMNLMTMLEDPRLATERILPWVVSTHFKDGGIKLTSEGLKTFTTELGAGVVDFPQILELLDTLPDQVNLNVEDHGGDFDLPIFKPTFLAEFPDLTAPELVQLLKLAQLTGQKIERSECDVVPRALWPEVCEQRMIKNLQELKKICQGNL